MRLADDERVAENQKMIQQQPVMGPLHQKMKMENWRNRY
jgi:hypothetical protein